MPRSWRIFGLSSTDGDFAFFFVIHDEYQGTVIQRNDFLGFLCSPNKTGGSSKNDRDIIAAPILSE